jgi:hypothetical protein
MPLPSLATNRNNNNSIITTNSQQTILPKIVWITCKAQSKSKFFISTQVKYQQSRTNIFAKSTTAAKQQTNLTTTTTTCYDNATIKMTALQLHKEQQQEEQE